MFQVLSKMNGQFYKHEFDTEKEANGWLNMIIKWEGVTGTQLVHDTNPVKPSEAPIKGSSGLRKNVFTGWKHIESSTITRREFEVTFDCYGEPTIDMFCDALNGWYTTWTRWRATFSNGKETIQITTHKRDVIDRLFEIINAIGPDSDPEFSEEGLARSYFQQIVAMKKPG